MSINRKQEALEKLKSELVTVHRQELEAVGEEYKRALTEIARLQNEKDLLKAREDVILSFDQLVVTDEEESETVDECIMEIKCSGSCSALICHKFDLKISSGGHIRTFLLAETENIDRTAEY